MQTALSAKGYHLSRDIMKTNQTTRELNDNDPAYDEELYFFTIMGTPSKTEPWGWQLDGHHLVINYFILGDQVVMTPVFMGAEPVIAKAGKYRGNTLFQDEQNFGLKFMQSLSEQQQAKATLAKAKAKHNFKTDAFKDNVTVEYEGIPASELNQQQQRALLNLANQYISNMNDGHAKVKLAEIKKHLGDTYFAWIGPVDDEAVFYYRIHSPVILIEFDHQASIAMPSLKGKGPTRAAHPYVSPHSQRQRFAAAAFGATPSSRRVICVALRSSHVDVEKPVLRFEKESRQPGRKDSRIETVPVCSQTICTVSRFNIPGRTRRL